MESEGVDKAEIRGIPTTDSQQIFFCCFLIKVPYSFSLWHLAMRHFPLQSLDRELANDFFFAAQDLG